MTRSPRPLRTAVTVLALTGTLAGGTALVAAPASASPPPEPVVMTPIGGGYELDSLAGFSQASAEGATGTTVDIVVVPSSYGDAPEDREENLELARQRTMEIDAACDTAVSAPYTGCNATLAVLLNRADALDPVNSRALDAARTDGIYILGGDQGLAMSILAASPAEAAMRRAARRGVVVGGTSAGAAVESRSMINGYRGALNPWDGLQRFSTLMWWARGDDDERGLEFGSRKVIYDQHFYQRGRFARLLSTIASSDDRFSGASKLGVGIDYATGIRNTGDQTLSGVFGASGVAVVDFETLDSPVRWVGPKPLLSTRNVVTHLLTPGTDPGHAAYDIDSRRLRLDGAQVPLPVATPWAAPQVTRAKGTVYLGGDVSGDFSVGVLPHFVRTAERAVGTGGTQRRIVVIAANPGDTDTAESYAAGLAEAGWAGEVDAVAFGGAGWAGLDLTGAAGVVVVGGDPTTLSEAMADSRFRARVTSAVRNAPAVLADRHMAAAMGSWWSPKADPTGDNYEDEAIANFRVGDGQWQRGLGLVSGSFVPTLTYDYRWGKLYDLTRLAPRQLAVGLGEDTALVLKDGSTRVVGTGSAVVLDGRQAAFTDALGGTIGAANVLLNTFAPGEQVRSTP